MVPIIYEENLVMTVFDKFETLLGLCKGRLILDQLKGSQMLRQREKLLTKIKSSNSFNFIRYTLI